MLDKERADMWICIQALHNAQKGHTECIRAVTEYVDILNPSIDRLQDKVKRLERAATLFWVIVILQTCLLIGFMWKVL